MFLSGADTGEVQLHAFREFEPKRTFSVPLPQELDGFNSEYPHQSVGVTALRFFRDGYHFASTNAAGLVNLWALEVSEHPVVSE